MEGQPQKPELQRKRVATREDGWLWRTEQIHTFKTVLQSVPMGTSAKVICGKVQAALLVENVRKSFDQVRDKYYRVVKSLVEYLGNKMPPKPHKQAAIHALMLQHWDRIAYPCKRIRRGGQQQISVAGSLPGFAAQHLQAAFLQPEPAMLASHPSGAGCSPVASAAARATDRGGATTGSASQLQQGSAAAQQPDQLCGQRLAPILLTHGSSGLLACSVVEPKTPAETPPQLSRAFTAEGPHFCHASPHQQGMNAPGSAQAHSAQAMTRQGTQNRGSQLGAEDEGRSASAKKQGPSSSRKAPKLALRIHPKDTETAEHIEAQGMLAYFELSCRGHKPMAALAAALEGQWGEAHRCSGHRMLLWGTLGAVPVLCWGPLSPPEVTVGDIHRTLGQPQPFSLSYTLKSPATAAPKAASVPAPAAAVPDQQNMSHSAQHMDSFLQPSSMLSPSPEDQAGADADMPEDAAHAQDSHHGEVSYADALEPCAAGMKGSSSAHLEPSAEEKKEPQGPSVQAEQVAAVTLAGTGAAQGEASLSSLDLFRPGATCSGFGTCLGLFRQGATCAGFETSFSGLFGHKQPLPDQDKPADSSAKSQARITGAPSIAGKSGNDSAQAKGSVDRGELCVKDSAGDRSSSRSGSRAQGTGSQEEPLSFAGAFSKACKRKQPSRLSKKSKGAQTAMVDGVSPEQPEEGSRQQGKRASKRKQKKSAAGESSQPPAPGRRPGNLPGGIFSEHTLAGLADGIPSHPSTASQLPFNAAGDLPDDLPAEPLVFWPAANKEAPSDAGQMAQGSEAPAQLEDFQPSQLGSLLGNGNSWDAAPGTGSAAAGATFCTERPFAELFAREVI